MKNVHMHAGSILFAAAISVGSLAFVATGFGADAPPTDAAKAVQNAADKSVDSAKDAKAAADQLTKSTIAATPAPAAGEIRSVLATITDVAVTKGGFNDVVKHFVDADRTRLAGYKSSDGFAKLDGRIDSFRKDWKSKYGQDFAFPKNSNDVLGDSFARISQGEIGEARTAAGKEVPSDEPKMTAGTPEELKKSGVSNTDANSSKVFGGDTKKDVGRNIATVLIPAGAGMPELAVPMIHELLGSWQIDLPDNIDGQRLQDSLLKHLTLVDEDRDNWPTDPSATYRIVARHMMMAIMDSGSMN